MIGPQAETGRDQQQTQSNATGIGSGFESFAGSQFHLGLDDIAHGGVNSRAGEQGEDGQYKIGSNRVFPYPGGNFGVQSSKQGGAKGGDENTGTEMIDDQVDCPG